MSMSFSDAKKLAQNLKVAYPTDTFIAVAEVGGFFTGSVIQKVGGWSVYRLIRSNGPSIADEKVKEKSSCCIADSRNITDVEQRRDFIRGKLKKLFPAQCRSLFLFPEGKSTEYFVTDPSKGTAFFEHQYGHAVLIVLM